MEGKGAMGSAEQGRSRVSLNRFCEFCTFCLNPLHSPPCYPCNLRFLGSSLRVHSWLASQKRQHVAALQSAPRAISEIRVIRGSLENLKKFSLNPVEGISTSDLNVHK
jgi:hypothetical protein